MLPVPMGKIKRIKKVRQSWFKEMDWLCFCMKGRLYYAEILYSRICNRRASG